MTTATIDFSYYREQSAPASLRSPYGRGNTTNHNQGREWGTTFAKKIVISTLSVAAPLFGMLQNGGVYAGVPVAEPVVRQHLQSKRSEALNVLRRALIAYQSLSQDWDGYGGHPADPHATLDALEFLTHIPDDFLLPESMLSGCGKVGLYWSCGVNYVSLEFEGDGTYTYLTDGPEGYGGDEGIPAASLPVKLREYLTSLSVAG